MTYPRAVLISWLLALLLALLLAYDMAHAGEWYADVGAGASFFNRTIEDGTWIQKGLPHSTDLQDFAYRVGIGYTLTPRWSIQANYVNFGTARISNSYVVEDTDYNPKTSQCLAKCYERGPFHTRDTMQGGELSVTHTWHTGYIQPFVRIGAALVIHHIDVRTGTEGYTLDMHGRVPLALVGGGACIKQFCLDSTYYRGFGGMNCLTPCGLPISQEILVTLFTVKVPLTTF